MRGERSFGADWRRAAVLGLSIPILLGAVAVLESTRAKAVVPTGFTAGVRASPPSGVAPLTVRFEANVSAGTPTAYTWRFGDGSPLYQADAASGRNVSHLYPTMGSFLATVTVHEGASSANGSVTVQVAEPTLLASIRTSVDSGPSPLTVVFSANVTGGSDTYTEFNWTFGDGGVGQGPQVVYAFQRPGVYHVRLNVTDSQGHSASTTLDVRPTGPTPSATSPPADGAWGTTLGAGVAVGAASGLTAFYTGRRSRRSASAAGLDSIGGPAGPTPPVSSSVAAPAGASATESGTAAGFAASAPAGLPQSDTGKETRRRWTRDVVRHLGGLPRLSADEVAGIEWTQRGISTRLGAGQNVVSNVLRRLEEAGVVEKSLRHVHGEPRRLKVYTLTPRGEALARTLRHDPTQPRR